MKTVSTGILFLALVVAIHSPVRAASPQRNSLSRAYAVQTYYGTELHFGLSIPSGGKVTEHEWETFLSNVVTPRFPSGFTVLDARGQYRQADNEIVREPTKIIVVFYSARTRTASRRRIEEIRRAYKARFKQESVMRVDLPRGVNVFF
jgi:hypothetical protein